MNYKKTTLDNGLRIITVPMKGTQTATVMILVGVGSRYESEKQAGLSHFIEHMLFKGTEKYPTSLSISEVLDAIGGEFNAFTAKDKTAYYAKVDAKHLDVALDVLTDIFLHSKIEQKEIDREKGSILQELDMYMDRPSRKVGDVFDELLYGKNPLGRDIVGYKETIKNFSRKDFTAFMKKHYNAENTVVCVAGNIQEANVIEKLQNLLKGISLGKNTPFQKVVEKQKGPGLKIQFKKTDQTHLVVGNRAFSDTHPDRFALSILSVILGGNMSSRLFIEVREKRGLAYVIRTSVDSYRDCGYIATQAGVSHKNLGVTIQTILHECKRLKEEAVSEKELRNAKDYIKGKIRMEFEASDEVALFHGEQEITKDDVISLEELFDKVEGVTIEDIQRVANLVFTADSLNLAVVGPHKDGKKFAKLLTL